MFKWETTKDGEVVVKRIFNNQTSLCSRENLPGYNITFIRQEIQRLDELRAVRMFVVLSQIMEKLGITPEVGDCMFGYGAKKGEMRIKIRKRRNLENQYTITFYGLRSMKGIFSNG